MSKIHGHTTIILKSKHGLVERVESENTFQGSMIAKYLRSLGTNNVAQFPKTTTANLFPLWKKTVGGLFLFRDNITEGSQYMPAGNSMVGAGVVEMTHTGSPTEWGSYNETESSSSLSAITQVYDYTTDQANGTIGCVCLTSRLGAQIGYGHNGDDYLGHYDNTPTDYVSDQLYPQGWLFKDSSNREWCLITKNSQSSYYQIYNGVLGLTKRRYGINKVSVFNSLYKELYFDLTDMANPMGATSSTYGYVVMFPVGGSVFRMIPSFSGGGSTPYSIPASGTVNYYELNADTETLTVGSFINPLSEAIYYNGSNGQSTISFTKDNCAIVRGYTSRHLFKINLTTGVIIKDFGDDIDFVGSYSSPAYYCFGQDLVPGLQLLGSKSSSSNVYIYDTSSDAIKRINIGYSTRSCYNSELDLCEYNMAYYSGGVSGSGNYAQNNPLYLATINNLETPVTKDATKTMKVIYRLEEA